MAPGSVRCALQRITSLLTLARPRAAPVAHEQVCDAPQVRPGQQSVESMQDKPAPSHSHALREQFMLWQSLEAVQLAPSGQRALQPIPPQSTSRSM